MYNENYVHKDLIISHQGGDRMKPSIRLNRQRLELRDGRDSAEVLFLGDIHVGHPQSHVDKAVEMINYCISNGIYIMFMGDMIEAGLTTSVGDTVYHQKLNPQEQMETVIDLLEPAAQKGLCIGYLAGNHEARIKKTTSIDVSKMICKSLKIPYLGYAAWNIWYVGNQSYTVYTHHGASGSRFIHTKLKAAIDLSHYFWGDVVAMGHVHDVDSTVIERQYVDKVSKTVKVTKSYIVLTGHYLGYDRSYAQEKGYPPSKLGSPKVLFSGVKKDVHVTT